jgi:hypothetical protein
MMRNSVSKLAYVRWIILGPLAVLGVCLGVLTTLLLISFFENLCPIEQKISGVCIASWYETAENFSIAAGSSLSAFFSVAIAFLIAPTHKIYSAATIFFCGASYGTYILFTVGASFAIPFTASIISGLTAIAIPIFYNKHV